MAVIALVFGMLLPALTRAGRVGRQTACLSQLRQIQTAYLLYAGDHQDQLVPNDYMYDARNTNAPLKAGHSWCLGNVRRDINTSNVIKGALFLYHQSPALYRCPSDPGRVALPTGGSVPRTRSYNLSIWLNTNPDALGSYTHLTEVRDPNPSGCLSFIDVHEDAIEDPTFGLYPYEMPVGKNWLDLPADRHGQGANLAFVDGHAEHWRWKARKLFVKYIQSPRRSDGDFDDFRRLQTTIPSTRTIMDRVGL